MRLTCPDCAAQYEVADGAIPEAGRDVQCSNCGHTWFQQAAGGADPAVGATPAPDPAARRRELDPAIAALLREEAEREVKARQAEEDRAATARPRRVSPAGTGAGPADAPATSAPHREEPEPMLPPRPGADPGPPSRGGFRAGFLLTLVAGGLALAAYGYAPDLARRLPEAAPVLGSYVETVDAGRLWLDDALGGVLGP